MKAGKTDRKPHVQHRNRKLSRIKRLPDESDPAMERGERIETGKMIARGGKSTGHVPGAAESKPKRTQKGRRSSKD